MMAETTERSYQAYTLRLWRPDESAGWRATLYRPQTGQRHSFASLERLWAFLVTVTSPAREEQPEQGE